MYFILNNNIFRGESISATAECEPTSYRLSSIGNTKIPYSPYSIYKSTHPGQIECASISWCVLEILTYESWPGPLTNAYAHAFRHDQPQVCVPPQNELTIVSLCRTSVLDTSVLDPKNAENDSIHPDSRRHIPEYKSRLFPHISPDDDSNRRCVSWA